MCSSPGSTLPTSYNYGERYMVELTMRRDGSSNFSPANKWANFPSVSVGWNLTNEPFMAARPAWLDRTKIRLSYGVNGNQNIGSFAYTSMMRGIAGYMLGVDGMTAIAPGIVPISYSNADLKWEESSQFDAGIDIGLWHNRLSLSLDYYDKRTNGMLMTMSLPAYIGNNLPWGNVGNMRNSGIEFDITWKQQIGDFGYSIGANGSYNKAFISPEYGYDFFDGWRDAEGGYTVWSGGAGGGVRVERDRVHLGIPFGNQGELFVVIDINENVGLDVDIFVLETVKGDSANASGIEVEFADGYFEGIEVLNSTV